MTQYSQCSLIRNIHALTTFDELRLIWAVAKNKITKKNYPLDILVSCFGLKYKLIDIESLVVVSPNFERNYRKFIMPRKGDVFIDIGAHIGKYTMQAAKIVGNYGRVIAFEADPITFKALREGIMANDFKNALALNIAIYDDECEMVLHSVPIYDRIRLGRAYNSIKRDVGPGVLVEAKPLDLVMDNLNLTKVDFIKIDVEGAELEVIKGGRKTIEKFKPTIVVEITMSQAEILEIIKELGYSSRSIGNHYFCFTPADRC